MLKLSLDFLRLYVEIIQHAYPKSVKEVKNIDKRNLVKDSFLSNKTKSGSVRNCNKRIVSYNGVE